MERSTGTRARDIGVVIGTIPTGKHNAITDVEGVLVGHKTLVYDDPNCARTEALQTYATTIALQGCSLLMEMEK